MAYTKHRALPVVTGRKTQYAFLPVSATQSSPSSVLLYRFGPYEVDPTQNQLRKFGLRVRLEPKPFHLLVVLLQRPGELVTRAELQRSLWGHDVFVDFEHGLNVVVKKLRVALSDSANVPTYIETVAREGYRFIADVGQVLATAPASPDAFVLEIPGQLARQLADIPISQSGQEAGSALSAGGIAPSGSRSRKRTLWALALAFSVALIAIAVAKRTGRSLGQSAPQAEKIMLVVLPFQNLSGDPRQDYFSDGMTEELSTQLGNTNPRQLGVIGRTSAMAYKHSERTIGQIGKELGVDYVLEGSVRRNGNQVRVTAQLVQVSDQAHVWAADYDENFRDLLQLETGIAAEIARHVGISIAMGQAKRPAQPHIPNAEAHDLYWRGRYSWYKRNIEGWKTAEESFRLAIQKDPDYAAAYAGLAECRIPRDQAQAAALKATSLDPSSGEAYAALGWVELYRYLDFGAAGPALRQAIELTPNDAMAHYTYGQYLSITHPEEAIVEMKVAAQFDPLSPVFNSGLANELTDAGRLDDALKQLKIVFHRDPRFAVAHGVLGGIYTQQGKYGEAIAEYQTKAKLGGDLDLGPIGYAYARAGDRNRAFQTLAQLQKLQKIPGENGFDLAMVEVGLGNNQKAIDWLQKSFDVHEDDLLLSLQTDRRFDPLREDPRFQDLVRKMNFPH